MTSFLTLLSYNQNTRNSALICVTRSCFSDGMGVVYRVVEKSTGVNMHARIFTNPEPTERRYAHQQMLAMQSALHDNCIRLVNVIENSQQVVLMYEM